MVEVENLEEKREKYTAVKEKLKELYGYPRWRQHYPPVDELVLTILSQNTNDNNSVAAFENLKANTTSWEEVRDMPHDDLEDLIRTAGLANSKAGHIQRALRHITETQGEITLDFLTDMTADEAKAWLTDIKGIGPKTASIVLLFSLNMPAFPVDTHVHRVSQRLGLIGPKTGRDKGHEELQVIAPEEDYYPLHLQMIQHGREICDKRNPQCAVCLLQDECDWFNTQQADE